MNAINMIAIGSFSLAAISATAGAATITAVTPATSDKTLADFRTTTVVKANDADGDNVYGTAGNWLYTASGRTTDGVGTNRPSYIASVGSSGYSFTGWTNNYTSIDNPTGIPSSSVANVTGWVIGRNNATANAFNSLLNITLGATNTLPANGFRLGVVLSGSPTDLVPTALKIGTAEIAVTGKDNYATSSFYFFDITGLTGGEVITLHGKARASGGNTNLLGVTGVTFDTIPVPEPMSLSLLGLGGLAMLRRRRA